MELKEIEDILFKVYELGVQHKDCILTDFAEEITKTQAIQSQQKRIEELERSNKALHKFRFNDKNEATKREGKLAGDIIELKAKLKQSEEMEKKLIEVLTELLSLQNGVPLLRYEKEYNECVKKCELLTNKN